MFDRGRSRLYNIHDYLAERKKVIFMTLEGVMNNISGNNAIEILAAAHKSIYRVKEEPFYIGTNFKQISSNLNSRFILISAPGATGKSAFGKHIAYTHNALYWNLAEISIGDGTFQGTLYRALGVSRISEYAKCLQNAEMTLVIDAFDEAEIISGRKNVENFLLEANEFLEESSKPSIVLLSRTETAQNIATLFRANTIPYIHVEIDFFPEGRAKEFVLKSAEKRKAITPAIQDCVQQYFDNIHTLVPDKDSQQRFLGYAPVLEAIAAHISEITNTAKLLSELRDGTDEIFLIRRIMDNLLDREHQKFVAAFREKIKEDVGKISDWEAVYSKNEQLVRILNYILLGEITYSDYCVDNLPDLFREDYLETIKLFLPQHPFIQNSFGSNSGQAQVDFTGPAFRDFSLASIILQPEHEASAELYYQREDSTAHFPSQLFWDYYIDINKNRINSCHFSYLFEAYKSKINVGYQTYLDISQDIDGTCATFRITKGKEIIATQNIEVDVKNDLFVFDSVTNTSINVEGDVSVGRNENAHITDSAIFCKKLKINTKNLGVNAFSPSVTTICCTEGMELSKASPLNILVKNDGTIQIDVPNIFEFPKLSRFKHDLLTSDTLDIYLFVHYMRRIFSCFRTHKKDMPARDAEKIDYVIVADNPVKKEIFDFLLEKSIVFREAHLYKVNLQNMSVYGISWGALISTNVDQLKVVYDAFEEWKASK